MPLSHHTHGLPRVIEGDFNAAGKRFALAVARWNEFIVDRLVEGALDALYRHGAKREDVTIVYCPGSFELPMLTDRLAQSGDFDAVIVLGAVIRGATPHFDYVAGTAASGVAAAATESGTPCLLGILTTDTIEQAIERAGTKAGNKGFEAAMAAIEMASLFEKLPPASDD